MPAIRKKYQEPQAHHWIVLRLARRLIKNQGGHARDSGQSILWLIREVGYTQLMDMILLLEKEEANNVRRI